MHKIELPSVNKSFEIPETVSEFTSKQFLEYCRLTLLMKQGEISYFDLKIAFIYILLDMKPSKKKLSKKDKENKYQNLYRLSELCDGYFVNDHIEGKDVKMIDFNFTDNKLPDFKHNGIKYIGPADAFTNLTFGEHLVAAPLFEEFTQTKDENVLNRFVAILYRCPKINTKENIKTGYDGDERLPYYPATVDQRQKEFETLPMHYKFAVYCYFGAVSTFITEANSVPVLGKVCDFTPLFSGSGTESNNIGRLEVLFALSKTKVFGNKKETETELYWTVLLELLSNHLEAERLRKQAINDTNK